VVTDLETSPLNSEPVMKSFVRYALLLACPVALAAQTAMSDGSAAMAPSVMNTTAEGVAIKGFDPVAYFTAGAAMPGVAAFNATHRGATFRFASAANRDAFIAAPSKYAPQYGGYCAMGVAYGRKFDVDPTAFKVEGGKLYLNKDARTQTMWLKDVPGNITKADGKWSEVAKRRVDG
jgi:YHS domain-containing protein